MKTKLMSALVVFAILLLPFFPIVLPPDVNAATKEATAELTCSTSTRQLPSS